MVQNQVYLFLLIDTLIGTLVWQLYLHPKYIIKHRYYHQAISIFGHYLLAYYTGFWVWLLSTWLMSMYLFGNFSLSHSHLPVTEEPTHWLEYSFVHTADVNPSLLCDWWMGYLNYQIEHHLFPTMPQFRHPKIHQRVKALAKKHNLPFVCYSYYGALAKTLGNLKEVSKQLKDAWVSLKDAVSTITKDMIHLPFLIKYLSQWDVPFWSKCFSICLSGLWSYIRGCICLKSLK